MVSKHAVRYLKSTVDYGLKYEENQKIKLEGYVDSDWKGSSIDRKSISGSCFSMRLGVVVRRLHTSSKNQLKVVSSLRKVG